VRGSVAVRNSIVTEYTGGAVASYNWTDIRIKDAVLTCPPVLFDEGNDL
jgi:hypothetical protein